METRRRPVVMITGANSGIGRAAAASLAESGAEVVMVCRNTAAGETVRREIIRRSGNRNVQIAGCDLSSQSAIRELVTWFIESHKELHVLINNAANFDHRLTRPNLTTDGVETIFATNHLGPFLLTKLLLDTLKRSSPARVLNVASKGLLLYPRLTIEFDNLDGRRRYSTQHAYYHSKLAQVMFTYDLAERLAGTGVTVNCIRVTNVQIDPARLAHLGPAARLAYSIKRRMSITPERMAEAYVRLALDPEFERVTGKLFDEDCREVSSSARSMNRAVWRQLWEVSTELTELRQA